ncbi:MAG: DapH/DapD/GlmU-related protein [Promethearchaeota archaeon]
MAKLINQSDDNLSIPVSIQDGSFTTNTLASKYFLIHYISLIWFSSLPLLLESYLFWKLVDNNLFLIILLLPLQIYIGYVTLVISSILLAKCFLIVTYIIHQPKEGFFKTAKLDKDYYFWSLRAVIKKWPIWISKFITLPLINKIVLRWFNNDSEFIHFGKNVVIGQGTSIRASMILGNSLIIKKVKLEDNVTIGSNSFISPGTHISKNITLGAMSLTKFNQEIKLDSDSVSLAITSTPKLNQILSKKKDNNINSNLNENTIPVKQKSEKFIKNLKFNISIFGFLYFISNSIPILGLWYYLSRVFQPIFLRNSNFLTIFINTNVFVIFLITPLFLIMLYIINLLLVILFTKLLYKILQYLNPIKEGIFKWDNKNKDYKYYFKRSFILRYMKWKIVKSPFPWLMKFAFNYIGNCQIGKNSVIEDSYLAKELMKVGKNSYIGKALLANHLWDKNLTIKKISIGDNVSILDNCCISPGTEIQENVCLLPLSITTKNDKLITHSINFNIPSSKTLNNKLIDIYNLPFCALFNSKKKPDEN